MSFVCRATPTLNGEGERVTNEMPQGATRGHVFVVHGKIEHLIHDAAIVPVDRIMSFNRIWSPLLGQPWPSTPPTWAEGWGRIDGIHHWLVQVGDGDYRNVITRLARIVRDIHDGRPQAQGQRSRPLVAMPVVGVGRGGHHHEPGRVVKMLLAAITEHARSTGLDFALVTPEPSVYAAAQFARRSLESPLSEGLEKEAQDLGTRAARGDLALFLGAGVSVRAGLKAWSELVEDLVLDEPELCTSDLASLSLTDQAEPSSAWTRRASRSAWPGLSGHVASQVCCMACSPALTCIKW